MAIPALIVGLVGEPGFTLFAGTIAAVNNVWHVREGINTPVWLGFDKLTNLEDVLSLDKTSVTDLRAPNERVGHKGTSNNGIE